MRNITFRFSVPDYKMWWLLCMLNKYECIINFPLKVFPLINFFNFYFKTDALSLWKCISIFSKFIFDTSKVYIFLCQLYFKYVYLSKFIMNYRKQLWIDWSKKNFVLVSSHIITNKINFLPKMGHHVFLFSGFKTKI